MKWIIIAWDQIRLNKKISIILVVFITMSIFLIGVISFYNNIFSYSQKQCEQVLTGTIDNIGLLYVENGDFYSQKAQDFINEAMDKKVVKFIGSISSLETDRLPELARLQGNEQGKYVDHAGDPFGQLALVILRGVFPQDFVCPLCGVGKDQFEEA